MPLLCATPSTFFINKKFYIRILTKEDNHMCHLYFHDADINIQPFCCTLHFMSVFHIAIYLEIKAIKVSLVLCLRDLPTPNIPSPGPFCLRRESLLVALSIHSCFFSYFQKFWTDTINMQNKDLGKSCVPKQRYWHLN